jgi:hypothetical protein
MEQKCKRQRLLQNAVLAKKWVNALGGVALAHFHQHLAVPLELHTN